MRYINAAGGPMDAPPQAPPPTRIALRLPSSLTQRIDEYAADVSSKTGLHVTRSAAVRVLLEWALLAQREEAK